MSVAGVLLVIMLPLARVAVHAPARIALVKLVQSAVVVSAGLLLLPGYGPIPFQESRLHAP